MNGTEAQIYWRQEALCKGDKRYGELPRGPGSMQLRRRLAQACFQCPVFAMCEAEAEKIPEHMRYGIWAGKVYRP